MKKLHQTKSELAVVIPFHRKDEAFLNNVRGLFVEFKRLYPQLDAFIIFNGYENAHTPVVPDFVRPLRYQQSLMIGKARNLAASLTHAEYLCFIDADVTIKPGMIKKIPAILNRLRQSNYAAVLPGFEINRHTSVWAELDALEDKRSWVSRINPDGNSNTLSGAFSIIKNSAFRDVGGFECEIKSAEDRDIACKILRRGYFILSYPGFLVCHHNRTSLGSIFKRKLFHAQCNAVIYSRYPEIYSKSRADWYRLISSKITRRYHVYGLTYAAIMVLYVLAFHYFKYRFNATISKTQTLPAINPAFDEVAL